MNEREFYEAVVPFASAQLRELSSAPEPGLARLDIESVEARSGADKAPHVAVVFRDPERPGCRFGWRWSWVEDPNDAEVEFAAGVLATNFEEDVLSDRYGLPRDCAPGAVTWF